MTASHEAILDSIRVFKILSEQKFKMTHAKKHMDFINSTIDELETELFRLSCPYDEPIKRISTMVGFTELSALFVLSEIGADRRYFINVQQTYFERNS